MPPAKCVGVEGLAIRSSRKTLSGPSVALRSLTVVPFRYWQDFFPEQHSEPLILDE